MAPCWVSLTLTSSIFVFLSSKQSKQEAEYAFLTSWRGGVCCWTNKGKLTGQEVTMMMLFFSLEDLLQVTLLTNSECNRVEENRSYYYL